MEYKAKLKLKSEIKSDTYTHMNIIEWKVGNITLANAFNKKTQKWELITDDIENIVYAFELIKEDDPDELRRLLIENKERRNKENIKC